jgi:hypothetical protein
MLAGRVLRRGRGLESCRRGQIEHYNRDVQPGHPKIGTVSVGHDIHGGHGYKSAVIDGYPLKFGTVKHDPPASSLPPPDLSKVLKLSNMLKRRKYYGEK